jgi:hypothetical protein
MRDEGFRGFRTAALVVAFPRVISTRLAISHGALQQTVSHHCWTTKKTDNSNPEFVNHLG